MKHRGHKSRSASRTVQALQELRVQRGLTQVEVAETLLVTQAALSKLERRSDVKVATLRGYVEALGGELSLVARFGDVAITVDLPYDPAPGSR